MKWRVRPDSKISKEEKEARDEAVQDIDAYPATVSLVEDVFRDGWDACWAFLTNKLIDRTPCECGCEDFNIETDECQKCGKVPDRQDTFVIGFDPKDKPFLATGWAIPCISGYQPRDNEILVRAT